MIPKVIHYCWFGRGEKSKLMKKCIKSWHKYCPDYEIIEWNEDNFDINCNEFVRQAYDAKKWAFVSDFARLKIIYENGGVYFDTDVEVIQPIDWFLRYEAFFGIQEKHYINTGLGFGAIKGAAIIKELMKNYEKDLFIREDGRYNETCCPQKDTPVLMKVGFKPEDCNQVINNGKILILSGEYVDPMGWNDFKANITENTYTIHHYTATWIKDKSVAEKRKKTKKQKRQEYIKYKIVHLPNYILMKILGAGRYEKLKRHLLKE